MYYLLTLLSILYAVSLTAAAKYPSNLQRCHYGDGSCLTTVISSYVRMLKNGRSDLCVVPLDPLHERKMDIIRNKGLLNINLRFTDISIFGLSNLNINKVVGFERDPLPTSKFEFYANVDKFKLNAKYKVHGDILLQRVFGSGPSSLTFSNVNFTVKFIPKVQMKNGKKHLQFSDVKLNFKTTRLYMQFDNLFNGRDRKSSDGTNEFLNKNWSIILNELKPVLKRKMGNIVKDVVNPIFDKFPYDTFFL